VAAYPKVQIEAIGDPTRFAILEALARSPQAVVELAQLFPISRPAVSQHLRVLKDAGLILAEKEGTRNVYQANPAGLAALRAHFDRMWTDSLAAFKESVESVSNSRQERHHGKPRNRSRAKPRRG
jgi:DNA-binding transcriptional ArsR family regulator